MQLGRSYCVTVMDHWTPMRLFWTLRGAMAFYAKHHSSAYIYRWDGWKWKLIQAPR